MTNAPDQPQGFIARLVQRFQLLPLSSARRTEVHQELDMAASPRFDYFVLVVLSCAIATFGLITDSPAVIIGAMLVAPLMSPILGVSLASVSGQRRMFERATVALLQGASLAILLAAGLGWLARILPFDVLVELPRECNYSGLLGTRRAINRPR